MEKRTINWQRSIRQGELLNAIYRVTNISCDLGVGGANGFCKVDCS